MLRLDIFIIMRTEYLLETPKDEGFVKKRGNSRKSNTRDSDTRGICEKNGGISWDSDTQEYESRGIHEKTGYFNEIKHSRLGHSRNL